MILKCITILLTFVCELPNLHSYLTLITDTKIIFDVASFLAMTKRYEM